MGPPLKAAENKTDFLANGSNAWASMGPPLKAAENQEKAPPEPPPNLRFNGAAAKSSGKSVPRACLERVAFGFNGAAAKSSGKSPCHHGSPRSACQCFNGAAAKSSGKLTLFSMVRYSTRIASMGPPLKAAENPLEGTHRYSFSRRLQWGRR